MRKPMRHLARRQLAAAVLFTAGLLWATNKGPDAGGYTATDSTVYSFIDPAGGGGAPSILASTDDGGAVLTLPFNFQFYGNSYTMLCVSTNGLAYFVPDQTFCGATSQLTDFANTDLSSTAVPGDLPAIAPFWTDLTFAAAGADAVYYQTTGTMPNRQFIVEWHNAYPAGSLNPVTFEAVLNETTNNIFFQYQTVNLGSDPASLGGKATIGIRNNGGNTSGQELQWSYLSAVLSNSSAILFTAPSSTATSVNTIQTSPSGITVTIDNVATSTPATVRWVPGSTHTLSVVTPQTNGGAQTTLASWSPSNATTSQISVQAQATGIAYTPNFNTQYKLTTSASPSNEGSVNGNGQFFNANSVVAITASPTAPFVFKGFTGDLSGLTSPQNLTMNGPKNVVATFGVAYACSVSGGTTTSVTDVQGFINEALGKSSPVNDVNGDGKVNIIDVQVVIKAVLLGSCLTN